MNEESFCSLGIKHLSSKIVCHATLCLGTNASFGYPGSSEDMPLKPTWLIGFMMDTWLAVSKIQPINVHTCIYLYVCVYIYMHIHMQRVLQTKIFGHFKFSWSTSGFNNPRKIIYYAKTLWLRWHRAGQSRFAEVQRKHDEPHGSWWACWVWWGRDAGVQAHADSAVVFLVCIFKVLSVKTIQHSERNNEMCFAFFSNRIQDELFIFISE